MKNGKIKTKLLLIIKSHTDTHKTIIDRLNQFMNKKY